MRKTKRSSYPYPLAEKARWASRIISKMCRIKRETQDLAQRSARKSSTPPCFAPSTSQGASGLFRAGIHGLSLTKPASYSGWDTSTRRFRSTSAKSRSRSRTARTRETRLPSSSVLSSATFTICTSKRQERSVFIRRDAAMPARRGVTSSRRKRPAKRN